MTITDALAWLRGIQAEDSWSMDFGTSMRNVLPQLIGVVGEAALLDHATTLLEGTTLQAALAALAHAVEEEKG